MRALWVGRALLLIAIFAGALFATAASLRPLLPPYRVPQFDEKLSHFAQHKDDYDTIFIGSSRTYHQVLPDIFDRLNAAAGVPTRTFNFGMDGLFPPEDSYVAEQLFSTRPARLRWVFIELSYFRKDWIGIDPESMRSLHWHDARRMGWIFDETFTPYHPRTHEQLANAKPPSEPKKFRWRDRRKHFERWMKPWKARWRTATNPPGLTQRLVDFGWHSGLFFRRSLNLGRAAMWMDRMRGVAPDPFNPAILGPQRDGAMPIFNTGHPTAAVAAKFEALRAERLAKPVPLWTASAGHDASLRRIVELARGAGAQPVLFVASELIAARRFIASDPHLPLVDLTEVGKHPQLFQTVHRIDLSHVDAPGSDLFTQALARQFQEVAAGRR